MYTVYELFIYDRKLSLDRLKMVKRKSRRRRAGRRISNFAGRERNILGQGTSVKSLLKGGVAVTLGNQVVGGIIR